MPVLCFVLDTSASMNRRTSQGQRLIDLAKTAIDNFLKKVEKIISKIPIMSEFGRRGVKISS